MQPSSIRLLPIMIIAASCFEGWACQSSGPSPHGGGPGARAELRGLFPPGQSAPAGTAAQRSYEVEVAASLLPGAVVGSTPEGPMRGSEMKLSGTWKVTRVAEADDDTGKGIIMLAQLDPRKLEVTAPRTHLITGEEYRERMRADLGRPVLIRQDTAGKVLALKADPSIMSSAFAVLRSLAATMQVTPGLPGAREWLTEEQDTSGIFRAKYQRVGEHSFTRKKLEYVQIDPGDGLRPPKTNEARVITSTAHIGISAAGTVESVKLDEQLEFQLGPGLPSLAMTGMYHLTQANDAAVAPPVEAMSRFERLAWRPLYQQPPPEAHQLEIDIAKVGEHAHVADIVAELDRLDPKKNADDGDRQRRLQVALAALLRLKPDELEQARGLVEKRDQHSETLLWGLASAGTPEAQRVVVDFVLSDGTEPSSVGDPGKRPRARAKKNPRWQPSLSTRGEVLVKLCLVPHPSAYLVDALMKLSKDPIMRGQALLGLGSTVFRLQHDDPPLARKILQVLATELEAATNAGSFKSAQLVLRAFGNAGHPGMMGILQPYLTSSQAPVRAAAVAALRRVDSPNIDRLLEAYSTTDTNGAVRGAARRALDERKSGARPAHRG